MVLESGLRHEALTLGLSPSLQYNAIKHAVQLFSYVCVIVSPTQCKHKAQTVDKGSHTPFGM